MRVRGKGRGPGPLRRRRAVGVERLEERCLLAVTLTPSGTGFTANEGATFNYNLGSFTESTPSVKSWRLEVDWGDGTAKTVVDLTKAGPIGTRPHVYADNGVYTVTERLVSSVGRTDTKTFTATILNVAPAVAPSFATLNATVSDSSTLTAVATDPSSADVAAGLNYSWDFGDGSPRRSGVGLSQTSYAYSATGTYTVLVTATDKNGATSPAASIKVTAAMAPIPDLDLWRSHMLTYGSAAAARIADPYAGAVIDPILNNVYYDAERVFYQLFDYTNDPKWLTAAGNAETIYRDRFLMPANGGLPGYWMFPKGLAMDYLRTGDVRSRDALTLLSRNGSYMPDTTPPEWTADQTRSREVAYAIETLLATEEIGAPRRAARLATLVDQALGHINQWFVAKSAPYYMPFMVGLTCEALIAWHQKSGDPRVPPAVKLALDGIWNETWDTASRSFKYVNKTSPEGSPTPAPDLNLLIAPAFAWVYNRTGDVLYRNRGDLVFAGGVRGAWLDGNKQFDQNYRTSFDYVAWRSQSPSAASAPPAPNAVTLSVIDQQTAVEGNSASINLGVFTDASTTGSPWSVTVDWGDGSAPTAFSTTVAGAIGSRAHVYADDGLYTVTQRVTSATWATDVKTYKVIVSNAAPTVSIAQGPYAAAVSDALTLTASAADASSADTAAGLSYTWDFGDGSPTVSGAGLSQVSHVFRTTGTFTVTVRATDKDGATSSIGTATVDATMAAIADLAGWRSRMTTHGRTFADAVTANPSVILAGHDPAQVFHQIADETGDSSFATAAARSAAYYRDSYVLPTNGGVAGTLNFGRGLASDFQRTGNPADKTAVSLLIRNAAYAGSLQPVSALTDAARSGETSAGILTLLAGADLGLGDAARLAAMADAALGHVDQWFGSKTAVSFTPQQVGRTLMALIRWGEASGDSRVAPAVKTALDWMWANAWSAADQAFRAVNRSSTAVQPADAVADLLIAPAFAWYYRRTGDAVHRDRGDQVFSGGVLRAKLSDSLNAFTLNYIWSFDFVKWRSAAPLV